MQSQSPDEGQTRHARSPSAGVDSENKRRKTRKGTSSCWECKRRKTRCNFTNPDDAVCVGCRRRGMACVSQEYDEVPSQRTGKAPQMGDRIVRVEALVAELVKKVTGTPETTPTAERGRSRAPWPPPQAEFNSNILTPDDSASESACRLVGCDDTSPEDVHRDRSVATRPDPASGPRFGAATSGKYAKISEALHSLLPSQEEAYALCSSRGLSNVIFQQMLTQSYPDLETHGRLTPEQIALLPPPTAHPVLIARKLLTLATVIQHLRPDHQALLRFSESPKVSMWKMVGLAARLVTTNDELVGCAEGLECLILECAFQCNSGNLRRSLVVARRAMVIAQLMGMHRARCLPVKQLDPNTRFNPHFVWYRLIFVDRHLCMMLGLPQGSHDMSMVNEEALASDTPLGRLERMHCAIASRIIDRNETGSSLADFAITQQIDIELRNAANSLPSKLWLPPNISLLKDTDEAFFETTRLITQLFHYNLLNQLHLPYMLRSSREKKYDYSKITCVNSSRETLSRFITFRSYNQVAFCCRGVDFFALVAAMTLILAHLDSHRNKDDNFLVHQRFSDRAMVEGVLENMENLNKLNMDILSHKCSEVLQNLLDIETHVSEGRSYRPNGWAGSVTASDDGDNTLRISIPYFGTIKITQQGLIFKETGDPTTPLAIFPPPEPPELTQSPSTDANITAPVQQYFARAALFSKAPFDEVPYEAGNPDQLQHNFQGFADEALRQPPLYPGLTANTDDWAFQGVDMAFFDSLMRGADTGQCQCGPEGAVQSNPEWSIHHEEPNR